MRHQKRTLTLDRKAGPRKALYKTLAISLITHERIVTTATKGRAVRQFVEPLITKGKKEGIHTLRLIEQRLGNKIAAQKVVNDLSKRFATRAGGYTRATKVMVRQGDKASQVVVEFVS